MKRKINDILSYQKEAIVSSEFIKNDAGSVTFFAFDEGQGMSEHTAPFDALVQITDGEAEIVISGEKYTLGEGEMILMPAGSIHSLHAPAPFKMILTMIKNSNPPVSE